MVWEKNLYASQVGATTIGDSSSNIAFLVFPKRRELEQLLPRDKKTMT